MMVVVVDINIMLIKTSLNMVVIVINTVIVFLIKVVHRKLAFLLLHAIVDIHVKQQ